MKLQIRLHPNDTLRKRCIVIDKVTKHHKKLADAMHVCMRLNHGVGLASPQIGKNIGLFVIDTRSIDLEGERLTCFNPEILEGSEETVALEEGCLSFPEKALNLERAKKVKLRWTDSKNEVHEKWFGGWTARAIQHEYDHLVGRLFIDYVEDDNG